MGLRAKSSPPSGKQSLQPSPAVPDPSQYVCCLDPPDSVSQSQRQLFNGGALIAIVRTTVTILNLREMSGPMSKWFGTVVSTLGMRDRCPQSPGTGLPWQMPDRVLDGASGPCFGVPLCTCSSVHILPYTHAHTHTHIARAGQPQKWNHTGCTGLSMAICRQDWHLHQSR